MEKTAPRMILASANFSIVIPGAADGLRDPRLCETN